MLKHATNDLIKKLLGFYDWDRAIASKIRDKEISVINEKIFNTWNNLNQREKNFPKKFLKDKLSC